MMEECMCLKKHKLCIYMLGTLVVWALWNLEKARQIMVFAPKSYLRPLPTHCTIKWLWVCLTMHWKKAMVTLQVSKETSGQNSDVILFQALICSLTLFLRNHFPNERKMKNRKLDCWNSKTWNHGNGMRLVSSGQMRVDLRVLNPSFFLILY